MDEPTVVVIGCEPGETSKGPIAVGEVVRLPILEGLQLAHLNKVSLADWHEQQETAMPRRGRYRRRDLRATK